MNQNLLAIYHQAQETNIDIFERLSIPIKAWMSDDDILSDDAWNFRKEVLINEILLQYSELCCYIGDPEQLQEAIAYWSATQIPVWQSLYESLFYKYNPIRNININVSNSGNSSDTHSGAITHMGTDGNTRTFNNTDTRTISNTEINSPATTETTTIIINESHDTSGNKVTQKTETPATKKDTTDSGNNVHSVAAYNNFGLTDNEKDTSTKTSSEQLSGTITTQATEINDISVDDSGSNSNTKVMSGTDTTTHNGTDANAHTGTIADMGSESWSDTDTRGLLRTNSGTETRKGTEYYGNLVDALIQWREYKSMNIYTYIAREFAKQFLIMIW